MKKIIYSLVIMIAAGSLFTSCVENTEPQGIKDLRLAKADYLDALSNLRAADAEKVKAEATLVQAKAAVQQAVAAKEQAAAKLAEANAKAKEIENDKTAADNAIALEKAKAAAEVDLVKQEKLLAEAEEALRAYLVKVEEESKKLTTEEQGIVTAYTTAYNAVVDKQKAVRDAEKVLYEATYNKNGELSVEAAKAGYESAKALAEQNKAYYEAALAEAQELSKAQIVDYEEWVAKYDGLQEENDAFKYVKADIVRDSALNEYENKVALDSFYAAVNKKKAAIKDASFKFAKVEKALPQVSFKEGSVVANFSEAVDSISHVTISNDGKKMTIDELTGDAGKKAAGIVVDSLNIIIDALNREKVVVDQIVKDTTGIAALVAETNAEYLAIKDTLEKGVAAYEPIAKAQAKIDSLKKVAHDVDSLFVNDTVALLASIRTFLAAENANTKYTELQLRREDSLKVWNAFIEVMKYREKVFDLEGADTAKLYYTYYVNTADDATETYKPKEKTVKFSELSFDGVVRNNDTQNKSLYGGYVEDGALKYGKGVFNMIVTEAVNGEKYPRTYTDNAFSSDATFTQLSTATNHLKALFFGKYWLNDAYSGTNWGKIYKGGDVYESKAVADAKSAYESAEGDVGVAKGNFYKNIYCKFWGLEESGEKPADSLKINFTEKTYTDPKVLVTFSGDDFFTPAKDKKGAEIKWAKVHYNDSSVALKAIEKQIGQNNIKVEGAVNYTLYAKTLAVAQFAAATVNYKENTQALAELTTIVKDVEAKFNAAKTAETEGKAKKDSLEIALTGKTVKKGGIIVDGKTPATVITKFIKADGTFNLAGEQKTLAEKYLTDYAKAYAEIVKEQKEIDNTIKANEELSKIYADYIAALAKLDNPTGTATDPDVIFDNVKTYWTNVLNGIKKNIADCVDIIKVAEGNIAKLEAGYDAAQIKIENAEDALAKAEQALEQAEVEFAVAEAAYEAVLANHGITE